MIALALLLAASPAFGADAATQDLLDRAKAVSEVRLAAAQQPNVGGAFLQLTGGTLTGAVTVLDGANCANPLGVRFTGATGMGIANYASGRFAICIGNAEQIDVSAARTLVLSGTFWLPDNTAPTSNTGAAWVYSDSTSHTWKLSNNGDAFSNVGRTVNAISSADVTKTDTTLVDVTGATLSLPIGTWACSADGEGADSTGADGLKMSWTFSGTATTATGGWELNAAAALTDCTGASATTTLTCSAAVFAAGSVHASMRFVVTVAGTLKLQMAQVAHTTGTATVYKGTTIDCDRIQ